MVYIDESACIGCGQCVRGCPMAVIVQGAEDPKPRIHPKRRCIQCMHCAAGCPKKAIRFEELSEAEIYPEPAADPLERLIRSRRSVRSYEDRLPDRELIRHALNTANCAPSGKNERVYQFTVVWGKEQVVALRDKCLALCAEYGEAPELNKLFAYGTDLLTCGAPCLIVAWSPEGCLNPVLDPTVSMAELELLLVQAGLSTCWGGYLRQVSDRFPEIRQDLGLGENDRVRCAIMVGYAKGEKYLRPVWRPEAPVLWLDGSEC